MLRFILLFICITWFSSTIAAAEGKRFITMSFPDTVIADVLQQSLPLTFEGISDRMEGAITLVSLSRFHISDQKIYCHLHLKGNNLNLVTQVANQNLKLRLGSAVIDFDCTAQIRYDNQQQRLYIRLLADGIDGNEAIKNGDIGKALVLFLNGREFGVKLRDLEPLLLEASNKIITIATRIIDIRPAQRALMVSLAPQVSSYSPKK